MNPMHIVVAAAEPGTWSLRVVSADGERAGEDRDVQGDLSTGPLGPARWLRAARPGAGLRCGHAPRSRG